MNAHDSRDDADLRALLHETAEQITPQGTLDEIKERTMTSNKRRWVLPTLAAAAAMALVVGGIGWMLRDDDSPSGSPDPLGTPSGDTSGTPTAPGTVPVYFVGDAAQGPRLYREFQSQVLCEALHCKMQASVEAAVTGSAEDPDYSSPWPSGVSVRSAAHQDEVLVVDLAGDVHDRPAGMDAATAELAVQQLIYSAQAGWGQGRVPVQLFLDGSQTDTVLGVPTSEPLAAADALDVLAPVQISSPANGAIVKAGTVRIEGVAATFEANVVWEVMVGGDAVVKSGFTTAEECCTLAPYSFTVDLEPGTYTIVVHDTDESGEGRPVNTDTREITVE